MPGAGEVSRFNKKALKNVFYMRSTMHRDKDVARDLLALVLAEIVLFPMIWQRNSCFVS